MVILVVSLPAQTDSRPQVGVHSAMQVFVFPLHATFNVASYAKLPDISYARGWGWDIAWKGTYVGWGVTAIIKYSLVFVLPSLLGVDPRFYFLGE